MADFFQQQDVPSCMSVDVINSCPADKQVLLEKNILCLAVLQTVLCGYETPWSPFRLSLAHPTTQFPHLITRRIRLQRHHHWSPSDASEDCLTWKPTHSFTKARTQAEPGVPLKGLWKSPSRWRRFLHMNGPNAFSFPSCWPSLCLWAFCVQENKNGGHSTERSSLVSGNPETPQVNKMGQNQAPLMPERFIN